MTLAFKLRVFGIASGLFLFELVENSTDCLLILYGDRRYGKCLVFIRISPSALKI
jgi:hypothetical protein